MSLDVNKVKEAIVAGKTALGIELGSTRIKAVLINEENLPIASGSHDWENQLVDGIWTYSLEDIWKGVQHSYQELADDVKKQYGVAIETLGAIGFSCHDARIHGL